MSEDGFLTAEVLNIGCLYIDNLLGARARAGVPSPPQISRISTSRHAACSLDKSPTSRFALHKHDEAQTPFSKIKKY